MFISSFILVHFVYLIYLDDGQWVQDRHDVQYDNYKQFFSKLTDKSKLVVIEVGAGILNFLLLFSFFFFFDSLQTYLLLLIGTAVQTVRYESERRAFEEEAGYKGTLIRINVRDTKSPKGTVSFFFLLLPLLFLLNHHFTTFSFSFLFSSLLFFCYYLFHILFHYYD